MMALEFLESLRCCGNDIFVGCGDAWRALRPDVAVAAAAGRERSVWIG
jgi:hypothetical protein